MAKLPLFKRLIRGDYEDQYQNLIDQLSVSLNSTIEGIVSSLTNNVTLADNVACTIKDINVTVDSSGTPKEAITITTSNSTVTAVICGKAENQTNSNIYPTSGVQISYTQNGSKININNIAGLPANNNFKIRVLIFA